MCSLVMSPFSCDYMKMEIDQIKYQQYFNRFTRVQNSHSAWFLDGTTSILVLVGHVVVDGCWQKFHTVSWSLTLDTILILHEVRMISKHSLRK